MPILADYVSPTPVAGAWSCFTAALRDARRVSGRDEATGQVVAQQYLGSWAGAVSYLCLFDQLGTAVQCAPEPAGFAARVQALGGSERDFRSTLYRFSDVTDQDAATLWALRNALAHNFSLVNVPLNQNRADLRHRFVLHVGGNQLVHYPNVPWDGQFPGQGGQTAVSVSLLGEVGETVATRLCAAQAAGNLTTTLTPAAFRARFFFAVHALGFNAPAP